jgi:hypothetical protein
VSVALARPQQRHSVLNASTHKQGNLARREYSIVFPSQLVTEWKNRPLPPPAYEVELKMRQRPSDRLRTPAPKLTRPVPTTPYRPRPSPRTRPIPRDVQIRHMFEKILQEKTEDVAYRVSKQNPLGKPSK